MSAYEDLIIEEEKQDNLTTLIQKCWGTTFEEFWDIITMGGQERHGKKLGVLSYEHMLQQTLEETKFLMVLKPVAAGITFFWLPAIMIPFAVSAMLLFLISLQPLLLYSSEVFTAGGFVYLIGVVVLILRLPMKGISWVRGADTKSE